MDIRFAETEDDIAQCRRLRRIVFIEEQGVREADEIDGLDGECAHVLATVGGAPAGAARIRYLGDTAKIQRVCVLKSRRNRGLGARLMRFVLAELTTDPRVATARLGSQTHALDFYRKLGFEVVGGEYMEAGISHRDMEIKLYKYKKLNKK